MSHLRLEDFINGSQTHDVRVGNGGIGSAVGQSDDSTAQLRSADCRGPRQVSSENGFDHDCEGNARGK